MAEAEGVGDEKAGDMLTGGVVAGKMAGGVMTLTGEVLSDDVWLVVVSTDETLVEMMGVPLDTVTFPDEHVVVEAVTDEHVAVACSGATVLMI